MGVRGRVLLIASLAGCGFEPGALTRTDAATDGAIDAVDAPSPVRRLLLDNTSSTTALPAIEVLVVLDSTRIDYASISDPQTDLRFEDGLTNANVPFEVESWDPAGESLVWIRVENVAAGSSSHDVLLYAGADANGTADAAAVWADWDLVQHFTSGLANSASSSYAGTSINTLLGPGKIGEAALFTGIGDQRITFAGGSALLDGWSEFSLMFWLSVDYANVGALNGDEPIVMDEGGSVTGGRLIPPSGQVEFQLDVHFGGSTGYLNTALVQNTWKLVTYTYDGAALRMYGNTTSEGTHASTQPLVSSTAAFRLGSNTSPFDGAIDELRISQKRLSLDQVRAHHSIMQRQFVTFAPP